MLRFGRPHGSSSAHSVLRINYPDMPASANLIWCRPEMCLNQCNWIKEWAFRNPGRNSRFPIIVFICTQIIDFSHLTQKFFYRTFVTSASFIICLLCTVLTLNMLSPEYSGIWRNVHSTTCDVTNLHVSRFLGYAT